MMTIYILNLNLFTYNSTISFLLNVKIISSSFTNELDVFSNIFCFKFFLVKYTFIKIFLSDDFSIYFFAS